MRFRDTSLFVARMRRGTARVTGSGIENRENRENSSFGSEVLKGKTSAARAESTFPSLSSAAVVGDDSRERSRYRATTTANRYAGETKPTCRSNREKVKARSDLSLSLSPFFPLLLPLCTRRFRTSPLVKSSLR